jgi:uncharacterized membrane protein
MPPSRRETDSSTSYLFNVPVYEDFVEACFGPIRRSARPNFEVTTHLTRTIERVLSQVEGNDRRAAFRSQLEGVLEASEQREHDLDRRMIDEYASRLVDLLPGRPPDSLFSRDDAKP